MSLSSYAEVSEEHVKKAQDLDLVLTCEVLTTGTVAIYAYKNGEDPEESEKSVFAENPKPGEKRDKCPNKMLMELIDSFDWLPMNMTESIYDPSERSL